MISPQLAPAIATMVEAQKLTFPILWDEKSKVSTAFGLTFSLPEDLKHGPVRVFEHDVPLSEAPPRPGDAVGAFANVDRAAERLDWHTELSLDDAIASALAWGERRQAVLGYE